MLKVYISLLHQEPLTSVRVQLQEIKLTSLTERLPVQTTGQMSQSPGCQAP